MQKKDAEKELVNEKILKDQKKAKIEKEVRELMDEHKELNWFKDFCLLRKSSLCSSVN